MRRKKSCFVLIACLSFTLLVFSLVSCDMFSLPGGNDSDTLKITISTTGLPTDRTYHIGFFLSTGAGVSQNAKRDRNGTFTLICNRNSYGSSSAYQRIWEGATFSIAFIDVSSTSFRYRYSLNTFTITNTKTFTLDLDTHFGAWGGPQ